MIRPCPETVSQPSFRRASASRFEAAWRSTKCCACHELCAWRPWRFTKYCACHAIYTWRFTECAVPATKSAHGGSHSAVPATKSAHGGSQSAALATKSARGGLQSAAPATKSAHGGSQSAAPAMKSAHEGSQSAAPAMKSAHGVTWRFTKLCLPRNLHFKKQMKTLIAKQGRFRE